jgi:hypothetical protein
MSQFLPILNLFHANILSLRAFCQEVGHLAEQQDDAIQESFWKQTASYLSTPVEILKSEFDEWEAQLGIDSSQPWDPANPTPLQQQALQDLNVQMGELAKTDPQKASDLFAFLDSLSNILPIQGELLRRGALFNLWSYFETLLTALVRTHYLLYPGALSERPIKLAELQKLSSVEEAIAYLATQEAEAVQRPGLEELLKHFEKLAIDLRPLQPYRNELSEIAQRRNLLTHNQGVVNRTYLEKAPGDYIKSEGVCLGQRLNVTEDYLIRAIDLIYLCGFILLQQGWRKWDRQSAILADYALLQKGIYQALIDERYEVARGLAEYATKLKSVNEAVMRGVIVNQAIALRDINEHQAMRRLLQKHKVETWGLKYQIACHVLQGKDEAFFRLLPQAITSGEIQYANLEQWPLFKPVRSDSRFVALLNDAHKIEVNSA